ncbi:hypothetical protein FIU95_12765 [Microbulbifer sp. THAF38]|nr:hypothetical protein FIU95_12765 [Microbulbifer sp. THAF38]
MAGLREIPFIFFICLFKGLVVPMKFLALYFSVDLFCMFGLGFDLLSMDASVNVIPR